MGRGVCGIEAGRCAHLAVVIEGEGPRRASARVRVEGRLGTHLAVEIRAARSGEGRQRASERGVSDGEGRRQVRHSPGGGDPSVEGRQRGSERGVSDGEGRRRAQHSPGGWDLSGEGRRGASASV